MNCLVNIYFLWKHFASDWQEIDTENQGRKKWRNCRLTQKTPDYQLGWAVLAANRLQVLPKLQFSFYVVKILSTLPVTLRVHMINGLSTVPSLRSSLGLRSKEISKLGT